MCDNIIILNNESSNEVEFEFLDLIEYDSEEYVVLLPVEDDDEEPSEVLILRVEDTDDDNPETMHQSKMRICSRWFLKYS